MDRRRSSAAAAGAFSRAACQWLIGVVLAVLPTSAVADEDEAEIRWSKQIERLEPHARNFQNASPEVRELWQKEGKRLLEVMRRDRGYDLAEGEELKHLPVPCPERNEFLNVINGYPRSAEGSFDYDPLSHAFETSDGTLRFGQNYLTKCGIAHLANLVTPTKPNMVMPSKALRRSLKPFEVEAPLSIQKMRFDGDWINRPYWMRNRERAFRDLEEILKRDFALDVSVTFREVERTVYVVTGDYMYTPVQPPPKTLGITMNRQKFWIDHVVLYERRREEEEQIDSNQRPLELHEFLDSLEDMVHMTVVDEITTPPTNLIRLQSSTSLEPSLHGAGAARMDTILRNLCLQTGLQFRKDVRKVKRFIIEPRKS